MPKKPEITIDIEALQQLGKSIGVACYVIKSSILAGYAEEKKRQEELAARELDASGTEGAPASEDCLHCWCHECGNFEDCIVPKEGYDIESKPCPCDGCHKGQRYMPKENPPCGNYKPETDNTEP